MSVLQGAIPIIVNRGIDHADLATYISLLSNIGVVFSLMLDQLSIAKDMLTFNEVVSQEMGLFRVVHGWEELSISLEDPNP